MEKYVLQRGRKHAAQRVNSGCPGLCSRQVLKELSLYPVPIFVLHLKLPDFINQSGGRVLLKYLPSVNQHHIIAQVLGLFDIMCGQKYGFPLLVLYVQEIPYIPASIGVDAYRWFIQK